MPGARPDADHAPASTNQPNDEDENAVHSPFPVGASRTIESVTTNRTTPYDEEHGEVEHDHRAQDVERHGDGLRHETRRAFPAPRATRRWRISPRFTTAPERRRRARGPREHARGRPARERSIDRRSPRTRTASTASVVSPIVDSRMTPPRSMRCTIASTSMAPAMSSTGICSIDAHEVDLRDHVLGDLLHDHRDERRRLRLVAGLLAACHLVPVPQPVLERPQRALHDRRSRGPAPDAGGCARPPRPRPSPPGVSASIASPSTAPGSNASDPRVRPARRPSRRAPARTATPRHDSPTPGRRARAGRCAAARRSARAAAPAPAWAAASRPSPVLVPCSRRAQSPADPLVCSATVERRRPGSLPVRAPPTPVRARSRRRRHPCARGARRRHRPLTHRGPSHGRAQRAPGLSRPHLRQHRLPGPRPPRPGVPRSPARCSCRARFSSSRRPRPTATGTCRSRHNRR